MRAEKKKRPQATDQLADFSGLDANATPHQQYSTLKGDRDV